MSAEDKKEIELELAHVLFIDIVGYSKRLINERCTLPSTTSLRGKDKLTRRSWSAVLHKSSLG
ncbi:MAG TPA: hypothetical protein VNY07_11440 [Chthoniobacterales bacterium]|nr:hypothetical protein [Chthoniobacterales bacterium]